MADYEWLPLSKLPEIDAEIERLKQNAGITNDVTPVIDETPRVNRGAYMREHNIKPGTPEWFQLWFARTNMTGESPFSSEE